MPSTFFGLTVASSALNAFQVAVNTTANNLSNTQTKGYTRQEALRTAAEALRVNQKYGTVGSGVETTAIRQIRDLYYDAKYWDNNANVGLYDSKLYYSKQIEDYLLDDDSMKGFTTILNEMFGALDTLKNATGDMEKRMQFISKCQTFSTYFNSMSTGFSKIQDGLNQEIRTQTETINSIGQKVSSLNKQINVLELQGGYANELRDQRALLMDQLSRLVPVEAKEVPVTNTNYPDMYLGGTSYTVKINGQLLVDNFEYNTLECVARGKDEKINQSDNEGLYDVVWTKTETPLITTGGGTSGSLRALFEMRDGNNKLNFKADTIEPFPAGSDGRSVVLSGANINDIEKMTMAAEGKINLGGKYYNYTGFSYEYDTVTETGKYTFYGIASLNEQKSPLSPQEMAALPGRSAEIGTSIDAMGIPYYLGQMNEFLRGFCKELNNAQKDGIDANGDDAGAFFVALDSTDNSIEYTFEDYGDGKSMRTTEDTYYRLTATDIAVARGLVDDARLMATIYKGDNKEDVDKFNLVERMLELKDSPKLFRGGGADQFLKCLISDNSVDTQKAEIFYKNFENMSNTIDGRRMSISAVDEDEEGLDMLKFQNAYNLASKMIQVMTQMYDRLILQTGV
ncbi:hypothetical protein FACS1894111_05070 [Clostridia bacterium]|nr:hypothetical protein FACS1894111_05070 [Clostridia bacterium]